MNKSVNSSFPQRPPPPKDTHNCSNTKECEDGEFIRASSSEHALALFPQAEGVQVLVVDGGDGGGVGGGAAGGDDDDGWDAGAAGRGGLRWPVADVGVVVSGVVVEGGVVVAAVEVAHATGRPPVLGTAGR